MNNVVCPSDEELIPLLAGETLDGSLDSHLQECGVCRRRLDLFRSDLKALRAVSVKMPPVSAPPPRPARIGKYLIVGSLDSGGQADVYRAIHPTLDKELAVKLSRHAVGRLSDHRPLLVAEGKLLAKLDHPGLARIYDLDFHDDLPFLAMEYVRGPNLRQFAADGPVLPRKAASIVADVGRALAIVHRHGIVHQDVKPQNILIDEFDRPRLIDFGMARLRHAWDDSGEQSSGGTPAYMAPEQARSEDAKIGTRSDVFSLGGVLYFLLTGHAPFEGTTVAETLALAGRCEFDRALLNKRTADRPAVPRRLREICLKAMAANPGDRYARVEDFATDLERYLTRPRRLARYAGGALAATLLVGVVATAAFWPQTPTVVQLPQPQGDAPPAQMKPPPFEVVIWRDKQPIDLAAALPLQPATDKSRVTARIPPGYHAVMLFVNGKGKVQRLKFLESPADGYTKLTYPAEEKDLATFGKWSGTEMVLVCAAEDPKALEELDQLVEAKLFLPTPLPEMNLKAKPVLLSPSEVYQAPGRTVGGEMVRAPEVEIGVKLENLRMGLKEKKVTFFQGVAYGR